MKRISGITILLVIITLQVSCSSQSKREAARIEALEATTPPPPAATAVAKPVNELPKLNLTGLDGSKIEIASLLGKKIIFILFQPDCDHCQNEARQISERTASFAKYEVYFISSATLADIKKFSETYHLSTHKNFHFANTDVQGVIDSYGPIPAPSIFIYDASGKLENKFEGEMEIDVVIKYL